MSWEDTELPARDRARALLDACTSRGALKRLGQWLDRHGDAELGAALVHEGRRRGAELPDEAAGWPGKRLLRYALAREEDARRRTNPIPLDESFTCAHCGLDVPVHGRTARDHCPSCLRSLHVDVVPGDRAARCGGLMDPIGLDIRADTHHIRYRCRRCGAERVNRALLDGDVPDDWERLTALSAGEQT